MEIFAETIFVVLLAGILIYLSTKLKRFKRYLRDSGLQGFGFTLISVGIGIILVSELRLIPDSIFPSAELMQLGISSALLGAVITVIDFVVEKIKKKELLNIEDEKRNYIKRVRKGLSLKDAQDKAKKLIKEETGKNPRIIATDKEFKTWTIFLSVSLDKYKVLIDTDGDVKHWEKLDELPSYLTGAN